MSVSAVHRLLARLAGVPRPSSDQEDAWLERTFFVLTGLLTAGASALSELFRQVAGAGTSPGITVFLVLGIGLNLAASRRRADFRPCAHVQASLILGAPFLAHLLQTDLIGDAGRLPWAMLAPLGTLLCLDARTSRRWFVTLLGLTAGTVAFDQSRLPRHPGMPDGVTLLAVAVDLTLLAGMLYFLLHFAVTQKVQTRQRLRAAHRRLRDEQQHAESLLLNILPAPIAARLKLSRGTLADGHPEVIVMFADIVDYTRIASGMQPTEVFEMLNRVFCRFDELAEHHGLERIKTIGDAYMVAGGLHAHPNEPHAAMAAMALDMQAAVRDHAVTGGITLELRIGVASGPVVAGVVGRRKFIYDLWGDTVNVAHRLCTEAQPSQIQCDSRLYERVRGRFVFAAPVLLFLKGKGYVPVYRLRSPRVLAVHREPPHPSHRAA